jgi:hypothetical protein
LALVIWGAILTGVMCWMLWVWGAMMKWVAAVSDLLREHEERLDQLDKRRLPEPDNGQRTTEG